MHRREHGRNLHPCSTCRAMASSVNSVKLSARQYHWRPGTKNGSKKLEPRKRRRPNVVEKRKSQGANRLHRGSFPSLPRSMWNTTRCHKLSQVEMLGEHRRRRDHKKSKKTVHPLGSLLNKVAIRCEDIRGLLQRPERRPKLDNVDGVHPKLKRSDHAEVSASAAHCPKEVGILLIVRGNEAAIGQHHVDRQQIVDRQSVSAAKISDTSAQRKSSDAGGGNEAAGRSQAESMGCMIDVAPKAACLDADGWQGSRECLSFVTGR